MTEQDAPLTTQFQLATPPLMKPMRLSPPLEVSGLAAAIYGVVDEGFGSL